jgi:hypothetical protein
MLPVSLDYPFLIGPSVFSIVYSASFDQIIKKNISLANPSTYYQNLSTIHSTAKKTHQNWMKNNLGSVG